MNWRVAEEVRNKFINLNVRQKVNVAVSQMYENWYCMPRLKKEVPFNPLSDHELEKVHVDKYILPFTSKKIQNFMKHTNDFLQDETNNKIYCLC